MGPKEEIRQAKAKAREFSRRTKLETIVRFLNCNFDGFYHVANGRIVRDNEVDYLPATIIL